MQCRLELFQASLHPCDLLFNVDDPAIALPVRHDQLIAQLGEQFDALGFEVKQREGVRKRASRRNAQRVARIPGSIDRVSQAFQVDSRLMVLAELQSEVGDPQSIRKAFVRSDAKDGQDARLQLQTKDKGRFVLVGE